MSPLTRTRTCYRTPKERSLDRPQSLQDLVQELQSHCLLSPLLRVSRHSCKNCPSKSRHEPSLTSGTALTTANLRTLVCAVSFTGQGSSHKKRASAASSKVSYPPLPDKPPTRLSASPVTHRSSSWRSPTSLRVKSWELSAHSVLGVSPESSLFTPPCPSTRSRHECNR